MVNGKWNPDGKGFATPATKEFRAFVAGKRKELGMIGARTFACAVCLALGAAYSCGELTWDVAARVLFANSVGAILGYVLSALAK